MKTHIAHPGIFERPHRTLRCPRACVLLLPAVALLFGGCGTTTPHIDRQEPSMVQASRGLRYARRKQLPAETRAAFYLDAAAIATRQMSRDHADPEANAIYNQSACELTDFLREADASRLWNRPLELRVDGAFYRLHYHTHKEKGIWSPSYFSDYIPACQVQRNHLRQSITQQGVGGTLVGIHRNAKLPPDERGPFEPKLGLVAPVTATLDFRGPDAELTLSDPSLLRTARVNGQREPLAADFTAPVAIHPPANQLWRGLMGLVDVEKYIKESGLFMIHPYDPNRIPVILIHGLISTPEMWGNVLNEVEADPVLRGHFQFWVFAYPTGNPPVYSALRLREELANIQKLHPMPRGCILVGHSMGGLIARMQATTTGRNIWDANFKKKADAVFARLPNDNIIKRALIFKANPQVKRIVFICTPHRGSEMANGFIGNLGRRLIKLPSFFVDTLMVSVGDVLKTVSGKVVLPTSISGLSPKSQTLIAMEKLPIQAPYHSIIGDRGRGDSPGSSDGVVPYRSSHLNGAQSELIVAGPHGSHELTPTVDELKRILRLHLREQ